MYPWDLNNHLDTKHRKCKLCEGYVKDDECLWEHMEQNHKEGADKEG